MRKLEFEESTDVYASSICQAILFLIFGRSEIFVAILGYVALGLESTLPIPQLLRYADEMARSRPI